MKKNYAGLPARRAAVRLLKSVLQDMTPLDFSFERHGEPRPMHELTPRDRAFVRAITTTSLRRFGQINDVLDHFIDRPLPKKCGALREILISATAQLLFLESGPHAVIDLAVRLAQLDPAVRRFDKLVNAVLRRVSREGAKIIANQNSFLLNTPEWLRERWVNSYGQTASEKIAAAHLNEAPLDLSVKTDPEYWAEKLGGVVLPTGSVRLLHKGRIDKIEGYETGQWWVQDVAATLPVKILGDVRGLRIADLCAAPGGKTAQLAYGGASVLAVDQSAIRLDRLRENMARLELDVEILEEDILEWQPGELFDAVLLDAPCMATGTIRRHPDILQLKSENDLSELVAQQRKMLSAALGMVKPGGQLVYCSCSLEPEEGIERITESLQGKGNWRLEPVTGPVIGEQGDWLDGGCIRTFPYQLSRIDVETSGLDGFFAAKLRKTGPL